MPHARRHRAMRRSRSCRRRRYLLRALFPDSVRPSARTALRLHSVRQARRSSLPRSASLLWCDGNQSARGAQSQWCSRLFGHRALLSTHAGGRAGRGGPACGEALFPRPSLLARATRHVTQARTTHTREAPTGCRRSSRRLRPADPICSNRRWLVVAMAQTRPATKGPRAATAQWTLPLREEGSCDWPRPVDVQRCDADVQQRRD